MEEPLRYVEDMRRFKLEPGEKLWVKLRSDVVSEDVFEAVRQALTDNLGLDADRIIVTSGMDLTVLDVDGS